MPGGCVEEKQSGLCTSVADRRAYEQHRNLCKRHCGHGRFVPQSMAAFRLLVGALILAPVLMFLWAAVRVRGLPWLRSAGPVQGKPKSLFLHLSVSSVWPPLTPAVRVHGRGGHVHGLGAALHLAGVWRRAQPRAYREDVTPNKLVAVNALTSLAACLR